VRILNAAEFLGRETEMLEARRKELYARDGITDLLAPGERRVDEKKKIV